jgi:hypothetical protein
MKTSFAIASDAPRPNVVARFRAGFTVLTPVAKCYFFDSYSLAEGATA